METNNIKLAQAIDFINKWVIDYYTRENDNDPDPYIIQSELYKQKNIDHKYFDHAIRIMKYEGFVEYVSNDEKDINIRALKHTPKGLTLLLNGGMELKVSENKNDKILGQQQVQSVIRTNRNQNIVFYLTIGIALIALFLQWSIYQSQIKKELSPIYNLDTMNVRILKQTRNLKISKDTVILEKAIDRKTNVPHKK